MGVVEQGLPADGTRQDGDIGFGKMPAEIREGGCAPEGVAESRRGNDEQAPDGPRGVGAGMGSCEACQ